MNQSELIEKVARVTELTQKILTRRGNEAVGAAIAEYRRLNSYGTA